MDFKVDELKNSDKVLSKNVELSVVGNQHICIIGENGVGKSTLLKLIWEELKNRQDIIASYMPQNYGDIIDDEMTPTEFLQANCDKQSFTLALTYLGSMKFTRDEMVHKIGELSGGQKAKLIFLHMVLQKANVLILDEPFNFLDPSSQSIIKHLLKEYNQQTGATIIVSSHNLDHTVDICPRIALMEDGHIIRDIDNHKYTAKQELEEYFNVTT